MCTDWMGRSIKYNILFECLKPGCTKRYPLEICYNTEEFHPCEAHDINLNDLRDMFGKLNIYCFINLKSNLIMFLGQIKLILSHTKKIQQKQLLDNRIKLRMHIRCVCVCVCVCVCACICVFRTLVIDSFKHFGPDVFGKKGHNIYNFFHTCSDLFSCVLFMRTWRKGDLKCSKISLEDFCRKHCNLALIKKKKK